MIKINQKAGLRFITKARTKRTIIWEILYPFCMPAVIGSLAFAETITIAKRAYKCIIDADTSSTENSNDDITDVDIGEKSK